TARVLRRLGTLATRGSRARLLRRALQSRALSCRSRRRLRVAAWPRDCRSEEHPPAGAPARARRGKVRSPAPLVDDATAPWRRQERLLARYPADECERVCILAGRRDEYHLVFPRIDREHLSEVAVRGVRMWANPPSVPVAERARDACM